MAESTQVDSYHARPAVLDADDDHWSVPQTAMFVTLTSGVLWALILFGVRWLVS